MVYPLKAIYSGGQTGADFAALLAAKKLGIATGGTAPKGWRIALPDGSDGSNPDLANFGLVEHESSEYPPRTKKNVADADGTIWFGFPDSPGGRLTISTAHQLQKPLLINPKPATIIKWCEENKIKVLNIAGNRESHFNPTISDDTFNTLIEAFNRPSQYQLEAEIVSKITAIALSFLLDNTEFTKVQASHFYDKEYSDWRISLSILNEDKKECVSSNKISSLILSSCIHSVAATGWFIKEYSDDFLSAIKSSLGIGT